MLTYFGCLLVVSIILIIIGIIAIIVNERKMIKNRKRMEFYARRVARRLNWMENRESH